VFRHRPSILILLDPDLPAILVIRSLDSCEVSV